MKRYMLEIYEPGSTDDVLAIYEADTPFGCIGEGDLMQPLGSGIEDPKRVLKVVTVEHLIWEIDGQPKHKTLIFTEALANKAENRLNRMSLSLKDRWMLSNQLRIMEHILDRDETESLSHIREAVENGYEMEYDWGIDYIYKDTMSEAECMEVLDILEMFDRLESSFAALADQSGVEEWKGEVEFGGWDGNNESRQLGYARHFCEGRHRFEGLGHRAYMNSHAPTLHRYRVMLKAFQPIWREKISRTFRYELSRDEIIRVLNAWRVERDRLREEYERTRRQNGES